MKGIGLTIAFCAQVLCFGKVDYGVRRVVAAMFISYIILYHCFVPVISTNSIL
jgi:hypothetical protein